MNIMSEKNVVVPTKIQMRCPAMIHVEKALISSMFHGRPERMLNHLKWTLNRAHAPVAAANNSSFVGRCIAGRWGRRSRIEWLSEAGSFEGGVGGVLLGESSAFGADVFDGFADFGASLVELFRRVFNTTRLLFDLVCACLRQAVSANC
jgi:hypothetical protein